MDTDSNTAQWQQERQSGTVMVVISVMIAAAWWYGLFIFLPWNEGMDDVSARMILALKWCCLAALFCVVTGVEAVAHERLQSPAFNPLRVYETRRLRVNMRYLQNSLEQYVVFATGLFGLAYYSAGAADSRAVTATAIVWILMRFAFWIGYHKSAAMRGIGMAGMMMSLLVLLYVCSRIGFDFAGWAGVAMVIGSFVLIEAVLFWTTRARPETAEPGD